jgi:Kef-type K+ transport system membrane component KefB
MGGAVFTAVFALAFIVVMAFVVRPGLRRLVRWQEGRAITKGVIALVFVALLLSALATEWIGIHAVFGAFLLGAIIPHSSTIARELTSKLEDTVVVLLLPAFFAYTGMRTQIGLVAGGTQWLLCGIIIATASAGKFGGSCLAARLTGLPWRDAAAIGILMNTRGLMELIVLNIGFDLRIISPTLFAMLVLMALVTTMATTPALDAIARSPRPVVPSGNGLS